MRKFWKSMTVVALGLAPVALLAGLRTSVGRPIVLYNPSPSEPIGFYRLSTDHPAPGRLIAFKVPQPGQPYAAAHLPGFARAAILKEVVAGEGALVCERAGTVSIDGKARGKIAIADRQGVTLPRWSGCQHLQGGQYFVLSNRIPNSFDSRYYGPVSRAELVGVYQPLWTE